MFVAFGKPVSLMSSQRILVPRRLQSCIAERCGQMLTLRRRLTQIELDYRIVGYLTYEGGILNIMRTLSVSDVIMRSGKFI
jgi:hypothetical protein